MAREDDGAVRGLYKPRARKRRHMRLAGTRHCGWGRTMTGVRCWPLGVLLTIGLTVLLVGCGSGRLREEREEREARINIYPGNFRAVLLAALPTYVSEPTGIREAYVSDHTINQIGRQNRYAACMRFNARNSSGRYVGSREVLAVFAAGRFDQFIDASTQQPGQGNEPNLTTFVKELCGAAEYKR